MQAELGGQVARGAGPGPLRLRRPVRYSEVVVQNDNFLMVAPYTDRYQTGRSCRVETRPPGGAIEFTDRFGNVVHRVRVTSPHRELIIAAIGQACLGAALPHVTDVPLSSAGYGLEADEFLTPTPLVDPGAVGDEARAIDGSDAAPFWRPSAASSGG